LAVGRCVATLMQNNEKYCVAWAVLDRRALSRRAERVCSGFDDPGPRGVAINAGNIYDVAKKAWNSMVRI